ncbi:MAG: cytochrome c family protein [Campylobacterales bacterium]
MRRYLLLVSLMIVSAWAASAQECRSCHPAIVQEWESSAHAMAHTSKNELYAKMVAAIASAKGVSHEAAQMRCNLCHAPLEEANISHEGVSCSVCHQIDTIKHRDATKPPVGRNMLVPMKELVMSGPWDDATSPYHGSVKRDFMQPSSDQLCLTCHQMMKNEQKVVVCATGVEHQASGEKKSCIECHMGAAIQGKISTLSSKERPMRSHRFLSARNSTLLAEAIKLSAHQEARELAVTLINRSSHNFPTGTAARFVTVEVEFIDAHGVVIASQTTPLVAKFLDAEGKLTLPPLAVKAGEDSRLQPAETRVMRYSLPKKAKEARVKIIYRLASPTLAQKLGVKGEEWTKPRLVAEQRVSLKP